MFNESPQQAWKLRYGREAEALPDLSRFLNHRSVRAYSNRPIDDHLIEGLVAAAQSAATSSNLQLWSVVSVQEPARRESIAALCSNQKQIVDAAWFFAFIADHHRLQEAAREIGEDAAGLDFTEFWIMACIDAALAAERMVCAAESLGIGTCYIGALRNDPLAVSKILNLPQKSIGLFGLCLGWPANSDTVQIKPRLGQESVWYREEYGSADVAEYDSRMSEFYEKQGMKGEVTWSMRSGRRVDENHLGGREVWKSVLENKRFGIK